MRYLLLTFALFGSASGDAATVRLLTLGDSIVAGGPIIGANPNWTELLQTRRAGTDFAANNAGVGGYTIAQTKALWDASYEGKGYTHAVLLVGTNDLASSTSAATVLTGINALVAEMIADGLDVTVCTVPPRGGSASWDSTKETQRLTLNTAIRAFTTSTPVNLDSALGGVGSPLALSAATDGGDHLHPNGTATTGGHRLIGNAIDTAVSW